jgi:hypothetical protein
MKKWREGGENRLCTAHNCRGKKHHDIQIEVHAFTNSFIHTLELHKYTHTSHTTHTHTHTHTQYIYISHITHQSHTNHTTTHTSTPYYADHTKKPFENNSPSITEETYSGERAMATGAGTTRRVLEGAAGRRHIAGRVRDHLRGGESLRRGYGLH